MTPHGPKPRSNKLGGVAGLRTTHTGSLPRPAGLVALLDAHDQGEATPDLDERVRAAVADVMARQAGLGLDLVNDGEAGKVGYATYVRERLTGFGGESTFSGRGRADLEDHPDFAARWA